MTRMASQITSLTIVYSTVYSGADQSKHQSSASLAFVWEIHRGPVNFPHKWPVTRKMFPFDDVIMNTHDGHPLNSNHQFVIQIKICAEYRDMLPRPRLVCQEPGLRPIGRSPGVPDKSSRGLGSMSRYSAQILICFIAYIFLFLLFPLWVWLGTVQDCHHAQCPLPLAIVIRMRLAIRQSKLPACLAEVQLAF